MPDDRTLYEAFTPELRAASDRVMKAINAAKTDERTKFNAGHRYPAADAGQMVAIHTEVPLEVLNLAAVASASSALGALQAGHDPLQTIAGTWLPAFLLGYFLREEQLTADNPSCTTCEDRKVLFTPTFENFRAIHKGNVPDAALTRFREEFGPEWMECPDCSGGDD